MLTADIFYITNSLSTTFIIKRKRPKRSRKKNKVVDRIYYINPGIKERFFLRILFITIFGPIFYKYLRIVNNVLYGIFKKACFTRKLITNNNE